MEATTFITGLVYLIIFLMFIGIVVWVSAEVQNVRYQNNYIHLKKLIRESDCKSMKDYKAIEEEFDNIYAYNDTQKGDIKKLWVKFQNKFRSISPYIIDSEPDEFSPESVLSEYNHI